jgi:hypothetical protein
VHQDSGPLLILAGKLLSAGPPSLSVLIARFQDSESYGDFISLIREFLPEWEREILHEPAPARQMAVFASHFEDRHFPLDSNIMDGWETEYSDLTRHIPVIPRGFSYDDFSELSSSGRAGIELMTYLLENPYRDDDDRVALAEACKEHLPAELLKRVPSGGFPLQGLHRLLNKTKYEALALWGDEITLDTGNFFLDLDSETLYTGYAENIEWSQENVKNLTTEWQKADRIDEEIYNLCEWLEQDPPARFEELLNFLLERTTNGEEKSRKTAIVCGNGPG